MRPCPCQYIFNGQEHGRAFRNGFWIQSTTTFILLIWYGGVSFFPWLYFLIGTPPLFSMYSIVRSMEELLGIVFEFKVPLHTSYLVWGCILFAMIVSSNWKPFHTKYNKIDRATAKKRSRTFLSQIELDKWLTAYIFVTVSK